MSLPKMSASRIHTIISSFSKYVDHNGVRLNITVMDLAIKAQSLGKAEAGPLLSVALKNWSLCRRPLWLAQRASMTSVKQRTRDFDKLHASGTTGEYWMNISRKSKMP